MGYDLHITRAPEHWATNQGFEISAAEWGLFVERDPELAPGGLEETSFTSWAGESRYPDPWFILSEGNIGTKNPDASIIQKMILIAESLKARVQGDDGEVYLADGKIERDGQVMAGPDWDWRSY